jgi:hypothetical protein
MALGNSIQGASRGQIAQCIEQSAKGLAIFAILTVTLPLVKSVLELSNGMFSLDGLAHLEHRILFFAAPL